MNLATNLVMDSDSKVSSEDMEAVCAAFAFFDVDKSGAIDALEMHKAMKSLGFHCTLQQAKQIISDLDSDGNGLIEFDEWVRIMTSKLGEKMTRFGSGADLG